MSAAEDDARAATDTAVDVERRMGSDGWRRDRDRLWYHVSDPSLSYSFDAARMAWFRGTAIT